MDEVVGGDAEVDLDRAPFHAVGQVPPVEAELTGVELNRTGTVSPAASGTLAKAFSSRTGRVTDASGSRT